MQRSRSNRRIAGVAGGLGDFLGVDATALRVGFVLVSVLFLAGIGGPLLYVLAWIIMPDEGRGAGRLDGVFSGRPWHDWDRTARSWAIVLASLALALAWSFGFWPWWHWAAFPAWLIVIGVVFWVIARPRSARYWAGAQAPPGPWAPPAPPAPAWPPQPPDAGNQPGGTPPGTPPPAPAGTKAGPGTQAPGMQAPGATAPGTAAPGMQAPGTAAAGTAAAGMPEPGMPVAGSAPLDLTAREAADWAEAQAAAARWAEAQLTAAGVTAPASPPPGPTGAAAAGTRRRASGPRRVVTLLIAVLAGLILLAVVTTVAVTLSSGSSLSGGFGGRTITPSSASPVATHYRLGAGDLDLNLANVAFPARGRTVDVTVGLGQLTVQVPSTAEVTVKAYSGIGALDVFGQTSSGTEVTLNATNGVQPTKTTPRLTLDAHVGMGDIQVTQYDGTAFRPANAHRAS